MPVTNPRTYNQPATAAAFRFEFIVFLFVLHLRIVSSALVIMTRPSCGGVCERRGGAASDDCRGFVDQLVVLKSLYHEQGVVHAARPIALEDGITYMTAPHGQALALALFQIAPAPNRPASVAGQQP